MSRAILIGEANPYGADPYFALYHLPREASGNRLREHLGLSDVTYEALTKVNLCPRRWSMPVARKRAQEMLDGALSGAVLVLLGAKVKSAFPVAADLEFFAHRLAAVDGDREVRIVSLPHPSGRNPMWNEPVARTLARQVLRDLVPEMPWGEAA